jgi:predicted kinase
MGIVMNIKLKHNSLVVLVGCMGTGKSTLAHNNFLEHNIVESDNIRKQLTGDFQDQTQNKATFEILFSTVETRAKAGLLTIIDSTGSRNVLEQIRNIGVKYKRPLVVLKLPHLEEHQITPERMKHRTQYINVYYRQVKRIDDTKFNKEYTVYEIRDINNFFVEIEHNKVIKELDCKFNYIVVPDLHGEYKILKSLLKSESSEFTKYIFLGDLVDRGESSYKTFMLVKNLIDSGEGFGVISNHDDKFCRWLKKWTNSSDIKKYKIINKFGMTLSNGLLKTVKEFLSFHHKEINKYAESFIQYYDNLPVYLKLEKNECLHFFAHAGVSNRMASGYDLSKHDREIALYQTMTTASDVENVFSYRRDKKVCVHLGHDYTSDSILIDENKNYQLIKHDIGIGKREIKRYNTKKFMRI